MSKSKHMTNQKEIDYSEPLEMLDEMLENICTDLVLYVYNMKALGLTQNQCLIRVKQLFGDRS